MSKRGEVLVATLNNKQDLELAREQQWYRIPVESVEKFPAERWEPEWLAFYQTKVFSDEAYQINYYGRVVRIEVVNRSRLFPGEPENSKSQKLYHKLNLSTLEKLPQSIISQKRRRFSFLHTTFEKLKNAKEISDL